MKVRTSLILLTLIIALCGCENSSDRDHVSTEPKMTYAQLPPEVKPARPTPTENEYKLNWQENCSVEQAYAAAASTLTELGLRKQSDRIRTIQTRDPRSGRTITQQVPAASGSEAMGSSDSLSAVLKAYTMGDIQFRIDMILMGPQSCEINILATSPAQSKDIIKQQTEFLKQKISGEIANMQLQAGKQAETYRKTVELQYSPYDVYARLEKWVRNLNFSPQQGNGGDSFYKTLDGSTASKIDFHFVMRQVTPESTRLDIEFSDYKDKEEFPLILESLEDVLKELQAPAAALPAATAETQSTPRSDARAKIEQQLKEGPKPCQAP